MKHAHMCPHFLHTCASLLQPSLLIVLPWIEFQNNYSHSQKMLLMKESLCRGTAEWIQAIFQISLQSYMHTDGGKFAWFDISVKGKWREKRKPWGRREKVEGEKNSVCTCVSIYCHCCNKIHI